MHWHIPKIQRGQRIEFSKLAQFLDSLSLQNQTRPLSTSQLAYAIQCINTRYLPLSSDFPSFSFDTGLDSPICPYFQILEAGGEALAKNLCCQRMHSQRTLECMHLQSRNAESNAFAENAEMLSKGAWRSLGGHCVWRSWISGKESLPQQQSQGIESCRHREAHDNVSKGEHLELLSRITMHDC